MKCELRKGELIKVDLGKGENLFRCINGAIWITTGNGVDYLLAKYVSLGGLTGRNALVEALEDSELEIEISVRTPSFCHISMGRLSFKVGA